jgi:uncharacterized protein (DUF1684 family)
VLVSSLLLLAVSAAPDPFAESTRAWQQQRLERLQADGGWLTLVGLGWLKEGANPAGSAPDAVVRFPAGAPSQLGAFTRLGAAVTFTPAPGAGVTLAGRPFTGGAVKTDATSEPDVLQAGRFTFQVISRGDKLGVRIKDPEAPARKAFHGIPSWAPDAKWRLTAKWEPAAPGATLAVPNVLGQVEQEPAPGTAVFSVGGTEYRLTPVLEDGSPQLFFVFGDETNKRESYGAGRFLYADPPKDGVVTLDFNRAYNPPCAFSAFATCPLPARQNRLPLRVEAGEQRTASH